MYDTITFLTDFGLQDDFVGVCRGVMKRIARDAQILDVTHGIAPQAVRQGALVLARSVPYLPVAVHLAVVDPGVGSERRPIIAETDDYIFVAPDNGVLSLIEARESKFSVRHVTADRYFLHPVSQTFHGRDIFAPVGGWLSKGVAPSEFGAEISDYIRLTLPKVERVGDGLRGVVLKVDKFGNLITNIGELDAPALFGHSVPSLNILIAGETITHVCHSYAEGGDEELFAIVGSSGYLEIAARQASAAEKLAAGVGTPVGVVIGS